MAYRWRYRDRKGAWQPTKREALKRAMAEKLASKCATTGAIFLVDGAELEAGSGRRG